MLFFFEEGRVAFTLINRKRVAPNFRKDSPINRFSSSNILSADLVHQTSYFGELSFPLETSENLDKFRHYLRKFIMVLANENILEI